MLLFHKRAKLYATYRFEPQTAINLKVEERMRSPDFYLRSQNILLGRDLLDGGAKTGAKYWRCARSHRPVAPERVDCI